MAILRRDRAVEFATLHHRNIRGERLEFDDHYYMLDILADPSPETTIMSAVQTGKSESFIAKLMADMDCGLSAFYVLPTRDNRDVFVQNRIDRLFQMVPKYADMKINSLGDADSVFIKHLGRGVARFGSSQSIREFKEFPADVLYVDEFDECLLESVGYADDRMKGSPYRFKHLLANPKFVGTDYRHNIHWHFINSDQKRLSYCCPSCGTVQWLGWVGNVCQEVVVNGVTVDYELLDGEWEPGCGRDVLPVCNKCGDYLQRESTMVGWVPYGDPKHKRSGYQISRLAPLSESLEDLWERFSNVKANSTQLQVFWNSDLGEPFEGGAGDRFTEEMLLRCCEPYTLPNGSNGPCTMGVDVGNYMTVRISDYVNDEGSDGKSFTRRRLVFTGKVVDVEELHRLIQAYHVSVAVIDANPEIRMSKAFQLGAQCRVWRCHYHKTEGANVNPMKWDDKPTPDGNLRTITVDRTEAIDSVFAEYVTRKVVEPSNFGGLLDGGYVGEMKFSVRMKDETTGRMYWTKGNDHHLHANVYDYIASLDPMAGIISMKNHLTRGTKRDVNEVARDDYGTSKVVRKMRRKGSRMGMWHDISG